MLNDTVECAKIKARWDAIPELAPKCMVVGLAYLALLLPYR